MRSTVLLMVAPKVAGLTVEPMVGLMVGRMVVRSTVLLMVAPAPTVGPMAVRMDQLSDSD